MIWQKSASDLFFCDCGLELRFMNLSNRADGAGRKANGSEFWRVLA